MQKFAGRTPHLSEALRLCSLGLELAAHKLRFDSLVQPGEELLSELRHQGNREWRGSTAYL